MGRLHLDLGWGAQPAPARPHPGSDRGSARARLRDPGAPPTSDARARSESIDVLARGESLVVASHLTRVHFYEARTVEAIDLAPPARMGFTHLTGPVPYAVEEFRLEAEGDGTELHYNGELGIDFFLLGRIAARRWVIPQWHRAVVNTSMTSNPVPSSAPSEHERANPGTAPATASRAEHQHPQPVAEDARTAPQSQKRRGTSDRRVHPVSSSTGATAAPMAPASAGASLLRLPPVDFHGFRSVALDQGPHDGRQCPLSARPSRPTRVTRRGAQSAHGSTARCTSSARSVSAMPSSSSANWSPTRSATAVAQTPPST